MKQLASILQKYSLILSLLLLISGWEAIVHIGEYPRFLLPAPSDVWKQLLILLGDGRLQKHTLYTLSEVIPGLLLGCGIAAPLGYLLAKSTFARKLLSPYLVASQAIPMIAVAPLLSIWVQSTYWSRVLVAVLVVFFPILINIIAGLQNVPPELYELMHALRATRWQIFRKLELPAILPVLLAGLKVGATLSVIGALVGEFVQPKSIGLGFLIVTARYQFKTDVVFVVLLTLGAMALSLYGIVTLCEHHLLRWQRTG